MPIIKKIRKNESFSYHLIVSGSHLDKNYGETINEIKQDNHKSIIKLNSGNNFTQPAFMAISISKVIQKITEIFLKIQPFILVVYGDRYETLGAVVAAHENNILIAHLEGGDITSGGTHDDNIRHAITKLSHLHFATNKRSFKKIIALGEEKWRICLSGFTALDLIKEKDYTPKELILKKYKLKKDYPILLFTFHPLSSDMKGTIEEMDNAIKALERAIKKYKASCIITYPNNDAGNKYIIKKIQGLCKLNQNVQIYKSLGRKDYWGIMNLAKNNFNVVCIGNSSSGIKESTAFKCPTINIGSRQKGRLSGENIVHVQAKSHEILNAINKCLFNQDFLTKVFKCKNPYGKGNAGDKIVKVLAETALNNTYLLKHAPL